MSNQLALTDPTKKLLVITDLEADDYFALFMLIKAAKGRITIIVSCWDDPAKKADILHKLLENLRVVIPVYVGLPSKKHYDLEKLGTMLNLYMDYTTHTPQCDYGDHLIRDADIIISLAPPRELITLFREVPTAMHGKKAAFYGSFNFRSLIKEGFTTADEAGAMVKSFEQVVWYETFAARGQDNTIADNAVLETIMAQFPAMNAITNWWNGAILDECNAEKPPSELDLKIIASITASPNQMVDADCGLVSYLLHGNPFMRCDPVDVVPSDRFTTFVDNPSSHVGVVRTSPEYYIASRAHTYAYYRRVV